MDHRRARAVRTYRERRLTVAEDFLAPDMLASFGHFCDLWCDRYDWADPEALDSYKVLRKAERRALYERFARECRLWEATLRLAAGGDRLPVAHKDRHRWEPTGSWRRRLRDLEEREQRSRAFYDGLLGRSDRFSAGLGLPWEIREAYQALGLTAGAPLEEVRRTFRRLALAHHPDRRGDHHRMADINRAYRRILEYQRTLSADEGPAPDS